MRRSVSPHPIPRAVLKLLPYRSAVSKNAAFEAHAVLTRDCSSKFSNSVTYVIQYEGEVSYKFRLLNGCRLHPDK